MFILKIILFKSYLTSLANRKVKTYSCQRAGGFSFSVHNTKLDTSAVEQQIKICFLLLLFVVVLAFVYTRNMVLLRFRLIILQNIF